MSETALWLAYGLAGVIAFAGVHFRRWPISLSMIVGAAVSLVIWLISLLFGSEENSPAWFEVDLAMNATFSLIFAGFGAAIAHALPLIKNRHS